MEHVRRDQIRTYILFNEVTQQKLEVPNRGLWYTHDLDEAREMRKAACNYLKAAGLNNVRHRIRIIDADTNEQFY